MKKAVIVIGGGISGLMASHVFLRKGFQVLCLDRSPDKMRKFQPQQSHVHCCLTRCYRWLEKTYPALLSRLHQQGAHTLRWGQEIINYEYGLQTASFEESKLNSLFCTRSLLDNVFAESLVEDFPDLFTFKMNSLVTDLIYDQQINRVSGVRVKDGGEAKELKADWVIDCRGSYTSPWKQDLPLLVDEKVENPTFYLSRRYTGHLRGAQAHFAKRLPRDLAYLFPIEPLEDGRPQWLLTLGTCDQKVSPYGKSDTALEEWLSEHDEYKQILKLAQQLEPVSAPVPGRTNGYWIKRYDWINGLLMMGDQVLRVCPIYGTGMSTASISAEILEVCLDLGDLRPFHQKQFKKHLFTWRNISFYVSTNKTFKYQGKMRFLNSPLAPVVSQSFHWILKRAMVPVLKNQKVAKTVTAIGNLL